MSGGDGSGSNSSGEGFAVNSSSSDVEKPPLTSDMGGGGSSRIRSSPWQQCAICLEAMAEGDMVKSLPCLHAFHAKCIDRWLRSSKQCPMCKHVIANAAGVSRG